MRDDLNFNLQINLTSPSESRVEWTIHCVGREDN